MRDRSKIAIAWMLLSSIAGCGFDVTFYDVVTQTTSVCIEDSGGEVCEEPINGTHESIWNLHLEHDQLRVVHPDGVYHLTESEEETHWSLDSEFIRRDLYCEVRYTNMLELLWDTETETFEGRQVEIETVLHIVPRNESTNVNTPETGSLCQRPERVTTKTHEISGVLAEGL